MQQFNLNVEHQLPGDLVLTVGICGFAQPPHLIDGLNLNVSSPSACDSTSPIRSQLHCGVRGSGGSLRPSLPPIEHQHVNDIGAMLGTTRCR